MKDGLCNLLILHSLLEGPKYGYELLKDINKLLNRYNQIIKINIQTLYSCFTRLNTKKYINYYIDNSTDIDRIGTRKKYYYVTITGYTFLKDNLSVFTEFINEKSGTNNNFTIISFEQIPSIENTNMQLSVTDNANMQIVTDNANMQIVTDNANVQIVTDNDTGTFVTPTTMNNVHSHRSINLNSINTKLKDSINKLNIVKSLTSETNVLETENVIGGTNIVPVLLKTFPQSENFFKLKQVHSKNSKQELIDLKLKNSYNTNTSKVINDFEVAYQEFHDANKNDKIDKKEVLSFTWNEVMELIDTQKSSNNLDSIPKIQNKLIEKQPITDKIVETKSDIDKYKINNEHIYNTKNHYTINYNIQENKHKTTPKSVLNEENNQVLGNDFIILPPPEEENLILHHNTDNDYDIEYKKYIDKLLLKNKSIDADIKIFDINVKDDVNTILDTVPETVFDELSSHKEVNIFESKLTVSRDADVNDKVFNNINDLQNSFAVDGILLKPFKKNEITISKNKNVIEQDFIESNFIYKNKLLMITALIIFCITYIEIISGFIIFNLTNIVSMIETKYYIFTCLGLLPIPIFFILKYLHNPNKKNIAKFEFLFFFLFSIGLFIIFSISLISIIFYVGAILNTIDGYINFIIFPLLLLFNFILTPIVYYFVYIKNIIKPSI